MPGSVAGIITLGLNVGPTGTCDYPTESEVLEGVVFDFGNLVGNVILPSPSEVEQGILFGPNGTLVGTLQAGGGGGTDPTDVGISQGASPFALISQIFLNRLSVALNIGLQFVHPVANDNYEVTETEELFAYVRFYGPSPIDPSTGSPYGDYGAGRRARIVGRRARIYIYTRSGEDVYGDDTIALEGNTVNQEVEDPPTMPGQFVAEEIVLNAFDNWIVLDGNGVNICVGPVHWVDSSDGPAVRKPEDDEGLIRSCLDFQICYILAEQRVEPALPTINLPQPNQIAT